MDRARLVRLAQACIAGAALGSLLFGTLPPRCYTKDLQVEYLTAMALRDGIDISTPLDELSARYFPTRTDTFPHASPHPPFLALAAVPLTILPFAVVVPLWLAFNIGLLVIVGRWSGLSVQAALPLAAWPPLWCLLYVGQFELLILAFAMTGWRAAAAGRDVAAGAWLGAAAAIKLYPILFVVPFLMRRRWSVLLTACGVFGLSHLLSLATVGASGMMRFFTKVVPSVSAAYVDVGLNSSPYGALLRLFGGAADVSALVDAPGLALPLAIALSVFALAALMVLAPEAAPVAVLVVLPTVWYTYPTLVLPQIITLVRSTRWRQATLVATGAVALVLPLVNLLLEPLARLTMSIGFGPPSMAVLLAVQPVGLLALLIISVLRVFKEGGQCADSHAKM